MRKIILFILVIIGMSNLTQAQNTEWVVSLGGSNSDKGISIGTDSLGFIYASGYFNTSATFGTITLTNSPASGTNKEGRGLFLVAGKDDVLVMDRIQSRHLWDDGRYGGANIYDGINGKELWKTDGTTGGTVLVKDIYTAPGSNYSVLEYQGIKHAKHT